MHPIDEWQWLENIEDPATLRYLKEENLYFSEMMQPYEQLRDEIYRELKGRIAEDDSSIPEQDGEYWYYNRYQKMQQYPLYCRRHKNLDAPEEIYLDHNQLADGLDFCDLGFVDISPDHRYVAYGLDTDGNERYTIHIKDLITGKLLSDVILDCSSCFEWKSAHEFFYIRLDKKDRPLDVYYHKIGNESKEDALVYHESDTGFFVGLDASESEEYIFILTNGYDANEVRYHRVRDPGYEFHLIEARREHHEYDVSHWGEHFIILSNWEADNFRLIKTPLTAVGLENWQNIQAHDPDILLEGFSVFKDYYILGERYQGLPRLKVVTFDGREPFFLSHDEEAYEISATSGRDFTSSRFRYWSSTPRTPATLIEYDMNTGDRTILKRQNIPDQTFDEKNYIVRRLWARARDGANIPLTVLHHRDLDTSQAHPLVMHAYGAYGETLENDFSSYRLSLVDRGLIYVQAHIRGGMDLGRSWYLSGKLDKKKNTFNDFIDATEALIDQGLTRSGWVIAEGGSAGGMLMGVIANEKPELFLGIIASVPFVDVLNTMLDEDLPLTTLEFNEWGNPKTPKYHKLIRSYSPYDNVRAQNYPHMLVTAGLNDKRVMYWEAAKWVARLRAEKTDHNLLLFRTELNHGHGGASGRYDALRDLADELCFICILKKQIQSSEPT
ncbi:MAG: S9 family peptidase [Proteobacteria bacterium]|nr:S9 family peptidase [Pseudomonadota bacterium]